MRNVLAVVTGWATGALVNFVLVTISSVMYPLPNEVNPRDVEAVRTHLETNGLPTGAMAMVLAAHAGGSLVSGLVCGLIARRVWIQAALGLGVLWTCGGVMMLTMIPAPTWFAVTDTILYIPAALLGVKVGGSLRSGPL